MALYKCIYLLTYLLTYNKSHQGTDEFCATAALSAAGTKSLLSTSDGHVVQLVLCRRQWRTRLYTDTRSQSGWRCRDIRRTWTADICALSCRGTICGSWRDRDQLQPEVHTDRLQPENI